MLHSSVHWIISRTLSKIKLLTVVVSILTDIVDGERADLVHHIVQRVNCGIGEGRIQTRRTEIHNTFTQ